MKKSIKNLASIFLLATLILSALVAPAGNAMALDLSGGSLLGAGGLFGGGSILDGITVGSGGATSESSNNTVTKCLIDANRKTINSGESVTINWDTAGFTNITLNGEVVSGNSGSKTFSNITENTTFVLNATAANGSSCNSEVRITCIPPPVVIPKECKLEVEKTVNKTTALPNEELTYTIVVRNTGNINCTGSGVIIEDVIDPNVNYLRHTVTSNIGAGYAEKPVYTNSDRTLHFNGFDLEPNESGTITWTGKIVKPSQCGDFEVKNQAKATALELDNYKNWAYSQTVKTAVDNECVIVQAPECTLTPAAQTVAYGGSASLNWTTKNANTVNISGVGGVEVNGTKITAPVYANTNYTLTASGPGGQVTCASTVTVGTPSPVCDSFIANPSVITVGGGTTLTWNTTHANQVFINNGLGAVSPDGSVKVSPLASATYRLTAVGAENKTVTCDVPVTVSEDPVPVCELFKVTPSALPAGGGSVTLDWKVKGATNVAITPNIGAVTLVGSKTANVNQSTTYKLTAIDDNGDEVSCSAPVTVAEPEPSFTCADNVTFSASDTAIDRGESVVLNWSTTKVDSVSITGINANTLSGNQTVSPTEDITYMLTAVRGAKSVSCPVSIDVSSGGGGGGGGGGGSSSPRCDMTISDKSIKSGDQVTLKWNTTRATEVTLTDDKGKVLFTTDDYSSKEKKDYLDGSIKLKPTRDTKYTLLAEKGSRDVECKVSLDVDEEVVVLQTRDQQPLVAGISLTQVPYTGFEAGPIMTMVFYLLLIAWSLYIAYALVLRKQNLANNVGVVNEGSYQNLENMEAMKRAEAVRPDLFVPAVIRNQTTSNLVPVNLPIGKPVVGYENHVTSESISVGNQNTDEVVTDLENQAHLQKALLSSDAIHYLLATVNCVAKQKQVLDLLISDAKKQYPLEDGWIVINELRMRNLCNECNVADDVSSQSSFIPTVVPEGSGSLAESIVTGNIVAAYEMIGNRPMFALADAASDLDSVYRHRRGEKQIISDLLLSETKKLSDEKIKNMITALTGALDGTYTDEASAVKMAIMKAVKEVV